MKFFQANDFSWAPRVSRKDIFRLYMSDASGLLDEALLNQVGISLLVRCETIRSVQERRCPSCSEVTEGAGGIGRDRQVSCKDCGWVSEWHQYHMSYKKRGIYATRAYPYFRFFMDEYPSCRTPRSKLLAIDRLIHRLHEDQNDPDRAKHVRPAAMNLIQGREKDIRQFMDQLAYSDNMPTGNRRLRADWFRKMDRTTALRRKKRHSTDP